MGEIREGAEVAEVTGLLDLRRWPAGMRVIVRRERPHPGAQLSLLEEADGWRYQAFATNTRVGQLAFLEARHRAHARVEDRIKAAKDTGLGVLGHDCGSYGITLWSSVPTQDIYPGLGGGPAAGTDHRAAAAAGGDCDRVGQSGRLRSRWRVRRVVADRAQGAGGRGHEVVAGAAADEPAGDR
jgi:hypothetical protein